MKRVAIFGKPGGGKSTLSKRLAANSGINHYALDLIEYHNNGEKVSLEDFTNIHKELIKSDSWIIDGLGSSDTFWARIDAADTIIYIDLPYWRHYCWVIKRLLKSLFVRPEGWPEGSSVFKGTMTSVKFLRLSPKFWTDEFYCKLQEATINKNLYRITSKSALNNFFSLKLFNLKIE